MVASCTADRELELAEATPKIRMSNSIIRTPWFGLVDNEFVTMSADNVLLARGYTRLYSNMSRIIPDVVIIIASFYYPAMYDNLNDFAFRDTSGSPHVSKLFPFALAIDLQQLRSHSLLPITTAPRTSRAVYNRRSSPHCPADVLSATCGPFWSIQRQRYEDIQLKTPSDRIFHLLDSFVVNQFISVFKPEHQKLFAERPGLKCMGSPNARPFSRKQRAFSKIYDVVFRMWMMICNTVNEHKDEFLPLIDAAQWRKFLQTHFNFDAEFVTAHTADRAFFFNWFNGYEVLEYHSFVSSFHSAAFLVRKVYMCAEECVNDAECLYQCILHIAAQQSLNQLNAAMLQRIGGVTTSWDVQEDYAFIDDEADCEPMAWREIVVLDSQHRARVRALQHELCKLLFTRYLSLHAMMVERLRSLLDIVNNLTQLIKTFMAVFVDADPKSMRLFHAIHVADNTFREGRNEMLAVLNDNSIAAIWWSYPRYYG